MKDRGYAAALILMSLFCLAVVGIAGYALVLPQMDSDINNGLKFTMGVSETKTTTGKIVVWFILENIGSKEITIESRRWWPSEIRLSTIDEYGNTLGRRKIEIWALTLGPGGSVARALELDLPSPGRWRLVGWTDLYVKGYEHFADMYAWLLVEFV